MKLCYSAFFLAATLASVRGHGYLESPRSLNYDAHISGVNGAQAGEPPADYCPDCLNANTKLCGKNSYNDYDNFKDSTGAPMPWISVATYSAGQIIDVKSYLATHHNGHMEMRACPLGKASTVDCMYTPGNELTFVEDVNDNMPFDPNYPHRGYFAHGEQGGVKDFHMRFKLPDQLAGEEVLLQWMYITANSCSPPGYAEYFSSNSLPDGYWKGPSLGLCVPPYPNDGERSGVWPERFYNCAEVTIIDPVPTVSPAPSSTPTTGAPTSTAAPTSTPVSPAPIVVGVNNGIPTPCCGWNGGCEQPDNAWCHESESQCTGGCMGVWYEDPVDPTWAPVTVPTPPTTPVTPAPAAPTPPSGLFSTTTTMSSIQTLSVLAGLQYVISSNPLAYSVLTTGGAAAGGVVSEGQGYAVLISGIVLASFDTHGDGSSWHYAVQEFEGYFNGWKKMCENSSAPCQQNRCGSSANSPCLPGWKHNAEFTSEIGSGAAPDGDEDAILGMILAIKAFDNYAGDKPSFYDELRQWADASCTSFLYENTVVHSSSSSHRLLKLGTCWGGWGGDGNNPSYHSPGSYKVMRDFHVAFPSSERVYALPNFGSGNLESHWNNLIDTSYEVLNAVQCPSQGMVPNWATVDLVGGAIENTCGSFSGSNTPQWEYGSEAARTTWRVTLDAALFPDEMGANAEGYLSPILTTLSDGYDASVKAFPDNTFTSCQGLSCSSSITVFGNWIWNNFIFAPTVSALIVPIPGISETAQQGMIDKTGEVLELNVESMDYYARCWTLLGSLTISGAVESAGNLLAGNSPSTPAPATPVTPAPAAPTNTGDIETTGIPCCSINMKECITWSCGGCNDSEQACLAAGSDKFWMPWGEAVDPDSCIAITYSCIGHNKPCCPGMICNPDSPSNQPCILDNSTPSPPTPAPVVPPTPAPVAPPTPAPVSPMPIAPVTPDPVAPETPAPITKQPVTPSPVPDTPAPVTPAPVTPAPVTPAPVTPAPVPGNTNNGIPTPCCGWSSGGCEQPDNAWCHAVESQCTGACGGTWYTGNVDPNPSPTPAPVSSGGPSCCTWGGWSTCPSWTQGSSDPCQMSESGCTGCSGTWISD